MATLPVEETESSEEIEGLVYKRLGGRYRGWRVELLEEQLTSKLEEKFLLCSYCSGVMRDACLLEREGKQELRCLVCIPEGVAWQPSLMSRESVNEKIIRCPLRERGCDWTGTVSTVVQHLEKCVVLEGERKEKTLILEGNLSPRDEGPQRELKCVESDGERRGEVVRVERRQLAEHEREFCSQRELKCDFCGGAVRACEMNPHLGECEEFPVDCPNGCEAAGETGTGQMKRGAVPLHLTECPLQRVECPYREYGCGEEMERRQLDLHEREYMHTHFKLAIKEVKEVKRKVSDLECKIETGDVDTISIKNGIFELKETIPTLVSTGQLEWKIKGVEQRIAKKEDSYSDPFYVGLYKCQGNIEWDCDNTGKVGCFICIMKGEFDDKLKWPFIVRYKFVLFNQNRNEDNHIWSLEVTKETLRKRPHCFQRPTEIMNMGYGTGSFISNTEILTKKYCKDDSISLHITMEQRPTF